MNYNKNNNENNPWGSGGGNNPWGSGGGSNNMDFEDSIKKAREKFSGFKIGGPRNFSLLILVALLIWLATGFYRVEPDEQGIELLFGKWNQLYSDSIYQIIIQFPAHLARLDKIQLQAKLIALLKLKEIHS